MRVGLILRSIAIVAMLGLVSGCAGVSAIHAPGSVADLASLCTKSVGADGYGVVDVTKDVSISNDSGAITVNCTLHLHNTARLTVSNSQIQTRSLIISDDKPDSQGSSVTITGSSFSATGSTAMIIDLRHPADVVSVQHSTIDYPAGVWFFAGGVGSGTDLGGGTIDVRNTTIRSTGAGGSGIRLVASSARGSATFINDTFQGASSSDLPLLYASTCHEEQLTGGPAACATAPPQATATPSPQPLPPGFPNTTLRLTTIVVTPGGSLPPTSCWATKGVDILVTATDKPGGPGIKEIDASFSGAQTGSVVLPPTGGTVSVITPGVTVLTYFAIGLTGSREDAQTLTIYLDRVLPFACAPVTTTLPFKFPQHGTLTVAGTLTVNGTTYPFNRTFTF